MTKQDPDLFSPELAFTMRMSEKAWQVLPIVTEDDNVTGKEHYRLLLGHYNFSKNAVEVNVEAVLDMDGDPAFYTEGIHKIEGINFAAIRQCISTLTVRYPEYQGLELVGDFHTHPVLSVDTQGGRSWHPSIGAEGSDVNEMWDTFHSGFLDPKVPFVFGIGGLMDDGKTGYDFYRLCHDGEGRKGYAKVSW